MIETGWTAVASSLLQAGTPGEEIWGGWGSVILVVGGAALLSAIVIVVAWQVGNIVRATVITKAYAEREEAYQRLADRAASAQERTAAELQVVSESVADLRVRMTSVERLMREVE